jgi:hypothetical protein
MNFMERYFYSANLMAYRAATYLCSGIVEEMNTSKSLPK